MSNPEDIVRDILGRLRTAFADGAPLPDPDFWSGIERDIRRDWGGDRPYIAKHAGEADRIDRDRRLLADLAAGLSLAELRRRYNLTKQGIYAVRKRYLELIPPPAGKPLP